MILWSIFNYSVLEKDTQLNKGGKIFLSYISQPLWVRFWDPKKAPSSCTHLGPAQVMEVIIIDV